VYDFLKSTHHYIKKNLPVMDQNMGIAYMGESIDEKNEYIGNKGVGKDTSAEIVTDLLDKTHESISLSLAGHLKDIVCRYLRINRAYHDHPERKELPLDDYPNWTFRRILEIFGTNVVRDGLKKLLPELKIDTTNIWLDHLIQTIQKENLEPTERLLIDTLNLTHEEYFQIPRNHVLPRLGYSFDELHRAFVALLQEWQIPYPFSPKKKLIQITDVRFFNEYEALKKMKCHIIKIRRQIKQEIQKNTHPSNMQDKRMVPDVVIENNGTKDDLRQRLWNTISNMK
jgi:hypothetical protein